MAHQHTRILFLGRTQSIANDLRTILCSGFGLQQTGVQQNGVQPTGVQQTGVQHTGVQQTGAQATGASPYNRAHREHANGQEGVRLEVISSQKSVMPLAQSLNPSLIFIEASNKPESRFRFCQWLRERFPAATIVAIGSTVLPYHFAFDAVLRTPIDAGEINQLIAHPHAARIAIVRRGAIELNPATRVVCTPQGEKLLTPKECALLQMLMESDGALVKRAEIINRIWETSYLDDTRTLDVHMRWLRRKIEPDPSEPVYLITRRGEGYLFCVPANEK